MDTIHLGKLIKHNDTWYKQVRYIKANTVMKKTGEISMEALAAWRDYCGADHVLRDQTGFMLCETIEDATIITDDNNV